MTISISPYLNFPGNTREVFTSYRGVLGGELNFMGYEGMETARASRSSPARRPWPTPHCASPAGNSPR